MLTFEELKNKWEEDGKAATNNPYDQNTMERIIKKYTSKQKNSAMRYFWASFTFQVIVYSLLCHVIVRYGSDKTTLLLAIAGALLYLPFTVLLMHKFKQMAVAKPEKQMTGQDENISLRTYVFRQYTLLKSFYQFKKLYELVLIPLSSAIATFLVFHLYFPGGVEAYRTAAILTFLIAVLSCAYAVYSENKKSFIKPLAELKAILREFA